MDLEKERRAKLIAELSHGFDCVEECELRHGLVPNIQLRADVVAAPRDPTLGRLLLAFEIKEPRTEWNYARWNKAIRQAADYIYGTPTTGPFQGRRVAACFLYPSPSYDPYGIRGAGPYGRDSEAMNLAGAFHLALHFRVGRVEHEETHCGRRLVLAFGPNDVWRSDKGFTGQAKGLLAGARTIGSTKVDLFAMLDELGLRPVPVS
jgi:hypothetical protein